MKNFKWLFSLMIIGFFGFSCARIEEPAIKPNHAVTSPQSINYVREGFGRINFIRFPGENPGHGQSFVVDFETIKGVEVYLISTAEGFEDSVTLQLKTPDLKVVAEKTQKLRTPLEGWIDFKFDRPVHVDAGQEYLIFLFSEVTTIHWAYGPDRYDWGSAIINKIVDKEYDYYFHIY